MRLGDCGKHKDDFRLVILEKHDNSLIGQLLMFGSTVVALLPFPMSMDTGWKDGADFALDRTTQIQHELLCRLVSVTRPRTFATFFRSHVSSLAGQASQPERGHSPVRFWQ